MRSADLATQISVNSSAPSAVTSFDSGPGSRVWMYRSTRQNPNNAYGRYFGTASDCESQPADLTYLDIRKLMSCSGAGLRNKCGEKFISPK